jgi:hypothetical protein
MTLCVMISISLLLLSLIPHSFAGPAEDGTWTPLVQLRDTSFTFRGTHDRPRPDDGWWVTPIQGTLLADGKVLITGWSRAQEKWCGDHKGRQNGTSFMIDPAQLDVAGPRQIPIAPISENPKDPRDVLYCAGHAPFPDGRLLFTGGARYDFLDMAGKELEYGLNYARVFDPRSTRFSLVQPTSPAGPHPTAQDRARDWSWYEQGMMWYPTNTRLPGGKQLVAGGFTQQNGPFEKEYPNKSLAIFDTQAFDQGKDPWSVLVSHEKASDAMNIGPFDYPHTYLLYQPVKVGGRDRQIVTWGGQNGALSFVSLDAGVPEGERMISPSRAQRPGTRGSADKTSLLLPSGKILVMGGGADGTRTGQSIDIYDPAQDSWQSLNTGITRIRPASTLLPDGNVLILNGEGMWDGGGPTVGDRKQPTIYQPATHTSRNLAPWSNDPADRGYHNISLLLKDGRVLVGGGRTLFRSGNAEEFRIGCERPDLRIFSPPYLFKGPRPKIAALDDGTRVALGSRGFTFRFEGPQPRAKGGVVLLALGAETHHFDQNQRFVDLEFELKGDQILAKSPKDAWVAPEGEYLLFVVSEAGVPSVAKTVRLTGVGN